MNIEEFKKKNKPKKTSSLSKFKNEIKELIEDRFTQAAICEYLKSNGVVTKQSNLSQYLKRHFKETGQKTKTEAVESVKIETTTQTKSPQKPTTSASNLLKKSEVKSYEIVEPDYSKFHH